MTISNATKLRWFEPGAAAFAEAFPIHASRLGEPAYVCPQCPELLTAPGEPTYRVRLIPKHALETGFLRPEHVPPRSFKGKELLLTCWPCNSFASGNLESHARKRENPDETLAGVKASTRIRATIGSHTLAATLSVEGSDIVFTLPPREKQANDPRAEAAVREFLKTQSTVDITLSFHGDLHTPRRADVTWLRHSYLALFAWLGYQYIFSPGLSVVRKQITDPDGHHISHFVTRLPGQHQWKDRRILRVREPALHQCWAVQIGCYLSLLPLAGDTQFYSRLASFIAESQQPVQLAGDVLRWPTQPRFGLE
jgi:hypothetical protein